MYRDTAPIVFRMVALLALSSAALANSVAEYDAGVTPAPGNAGAADPISQGWTYAWTGSSVWAEAYDSGDGGWRIIDATGGTYAYYQYDLSAQNIASMSGGWTLSATLSLDSDVIQSDGDTVDDYYLPPNNTRQNNYSLWVEDTAGNYRYIVKMKTDENSNLIAFDGTNSYQLTNDGSGYDDFKTVEIIYDGVSASLMFDGQSYPLVTSGAASVDRVIWGAVSSGGQGAAIMNKLMLTPEPMSLVLIGLGISLLRRR